MKILTIGAMLLGLMLGTGSASAVTYDFTGSNANAGAPFTLGCIAGGNFNVGGQVNVGCSVTYNNAGVGISGFPDIDPGHIDSFPIGSSESLLIRFTQPFTLLALTLGDFGRNDDFEYAVDGGAFSSSLTTSGLDFGTAGRVILSIIIRASSFSTSEAFRTDSFTLASLTGFTTSSQVAPAPVPVPAGVALGATALGGLGLVGWRKRAKARAAA
jgi:hypothetical protein